MTQTDAAPYVYRLKLADYMLESRELAPSPYDPPVAGGWDARAREALGGSASDWPRSSSCRVLLPPDIRSAPLPRRVAEILDECTRYLDVYHAARLMPLLSEARVLMSFYMDAGGSVEDNAGLNLFIDQLANAVAALESVGAQLGVDLEYED